MSHPIDESIYYEKLKTFTKTELINVLHTMNQPVGINSTKEQLISKILSKNFEKSGSKESKRDPHMKKRKLNVCIPTFLKFIITSFFLALFWNEIQRLWYIKNYKYCKNGKNDNKCIKCPENSICHERKVKCDKGYKKLTELNKIICIKDNEDWEIVSNIVIEVWNILKYAAGKFKCKNKDRDWLSYDEIDFDIFLKFKIEPEKFDILLNKSISYLTKENLVIESQVNDTKVFASIEYELPMKYKIINHIKGNIKRVINLSIVTCLLYILSKKRENDNLVHKRSPHYMSIVSEFIRNSSTFEVSDEQILQRLSKETKDYLKYWKYIDHELEMAPLIQVRKDGNHKYYRFVHE